MCIETRLHVVPPCRIERTKTGASSALPSEALHEEVTCACQRETGAIDFGATLLSQVLRTSRSSLQHLHNRLSIHLDPCQSAERYFSISLSSDKSAFSCVPLLTRFRSWSCCDTSCRGARSLDTQGSRSVSIHAFPRSLHRTKTRQLHGTRVYQNEANHFQKLSGSVVATTKLRNHARTRDWTGLSLHLSHDRQSLLCTSVLGIVLKAYKDGHMQQLQRRVFAVVRCALKMEKTQPTRLRFVISALTPTKCLHLFSTRQPNRIKHTSQH